MFNRLWRILAPFVAFAGAILFIVLGVRSLQNRAVFVKATGVISDIQIEYDTAQDRNDHTVTVQYEVDGVTRKANLGEYSSSMRVGRSVDILYNPENPDEIMSAGLFGPVMEFVMGALCVVLCVLMLLKRLQGRAA